MSTKTLGVVGQGSGRKKKLGIELRPVTSIPTVFQPVEFHAFAPYGMILSRSAF